MGKIIYSCRLCGVEDIVVVKRGSFVCPDGSGAAVGGDAGEKKGCVGRERVRRACERERARERERRIERQRKAAVNGGSDVPRREGPQEDGGGGDASLLRSLRYNAIYYILPSTVYTHHSPQHYTSLL